MYYYDLETFLYCFLFIGMFDADEEPQVFEISSRRNDKQLLLQHLESLRRDHVEMVGYNNNHFDYPIIASLMKNPHVFNQQKAYMLGQEIIKSIRPTVIPARQRLIPQIDLMAMNHLNNEAKRTRLKDLQFVMRSETLVDLPYAPEDALTPSQMDELIHYGCNDVKKTRDFGRRCKDGIELRRQILADKMLYGDVMNFDDVKIGERYLINEIGRELCFDSEGNARKSPRSLLKYTDMILPNNFKTEPYQKVYQWFASQSHDVMGEDKSPSLEVNLAGIDFKFGIGGVHASVENEIFKSTADRMILDLDVAGMYGAVPIANGFYPEHLGPRFIEVYGRLATERNKYAKGTAKNTMIKLSVNGSFGKTNSIYSALYDPMYMMKVTLNGQLILLQLIEILASNPELKVIQANTDGTTIEFPRAHLPWVQEVARIWEANQRLKLEHTEYDYMFISDVNNYIARSTAGKVKLKGKFWYPKTEKDYDGQWHKDYSSLVVQRLAEQYILYGHRPESLIKLHNDPFDFMLRYKTRGAAKVFIGSEQTTKTVRYYVTTDGEPMTKRTPAKGVLGAYKRKNGLTDRQYRDIAKTIPEGTWDERIHTKKKSKYASREETIHADRLVTCCNDASDFSFQNIDYDYYINEVYKLANQEELYANQKSVETNR